MKQLSGAALSSGGAQLICKDFGILGFPRMFRTYDEYDYFIDNMGGYFEKEFEKNGFVLMGWSEVGFIQIFCQIVLYRKLHKIIKKFEIKRFISAAGCKACF